MTQFVLQKQAGLEEEDLLQGKFKQNSDSQPEHSSFMTQFVLQKQADLEEEELLQGKFKQNADSQPEHSNFMTQFVSQRKENKTELPDSLKTGVEQLSGVDMSDVKVHRNSNKPANVQAHAYTQGTDIHIASGQEKHLAHEAWHVAQQKQGRVKPTTEVKGMPVNDNKSLETEADVMGAKATQMKQNENISSSDNSNSTNEQHHDNDIVQYKLGNVPPNSKFMKKGTLEGWGDFLDRRQEYLKLINKTPNGEDNDKIISSLETVKEAAEKAKDADWKGQKETRKVYLERFLCDVDFENKAIIYAKKNMAQYTEQKTMSAIIKKVRNEISVDSSRMYVALSNKNTKNDDIMKALSDAGKFVKDKVQSFGEEDKAKVTKHVETKSLDMPKKYEDIDWIDKFKKWFGNIEGNIIGWAMKTGLTGLLTSIYKLWATNKTWEKIKTGTNDVIKSYRERGWIGIRSQLLTHSLNILEGLSTLLAMIVPSVGVALTIATKFIKSVRQVIGGLWTIIKYLFRQAGKERSEVSEALVAKTETRDEASIKYIDQFMDIGIGAKLKAKIPEQGEDMEERTEWQTWKSKKGKMDPQLRNYVRKTLINLIA